MKSVPLSVAKTELSKIVDEIRSERSAVQIVKHEKPVVALVHWGLFEQMLKAWEKEQLAIVKEALKERRYPLSDLVAELEKS
jgi:PHD/YefM family antitoxin component YafN of YafNO toxin-antitoxin module